VTAPVATSRSQLPGAPLARFLEARGRAVFELGGILWARPGRTFFQNLPFGAPVEPDRHALRAALRSRRAVGAAYATTTRPGWSSGLFACFPKEYSLASVEPGHRRQVRRGLERAELRRVDPDELLASGLELNLQTMARHRRFDPEFGAPARWRRFVAAARDCPGVEISGAFVAGRLAAYWVSCRDPPWLHLLHKMARTEDLIHRAAVALDFWIVTEAAKLPEIEAVSNSFVASVSGGASLDHYKRSMGFQVLPHRRAVELHPALRPVLTSAAALEVARLASRLRPASGRLRLLSAFLATARTGAASDASDPG